MGNRSRRGGRGLHRHLGTVLRDVHKDGSGRGGRRGGGMSPHGQLEGGNEVGERLEGSLILRQFIDMKRKGDGQRPDQIDEGYGHSRGGRGI